jgi:hypothetical protein
MIDGIIPRGEQRQKQGDRYGNESQHEGCGQFYARGEQRF